MNVPIHKIKLTATEYRLLWWLLANQERDGWDYPTGTVAAGWHKRAMRELGLAQTNLWHAKKSLREAGIIEAERFERELRIRPEAFYA